MGYMIFESCLSSIFLIYFLGKANEIKNKQICTVKKTFQKMKMCPLLCVCVCVHTCVFLIRCV